MTLFSAEETASGRDLRLDVFLAARLGRSRAHVQRLIGEGHVRVSPSPARLTSNYRVRAGDEIAVEAPPPDSAFATGLIPEAIPLDVLHEDDAIVVVNKPPGLVVHPAAGHAAGTLVQALLHHCGTQLADRGGVERLGIVHRLDKDTSGVLVVAKTNLAHEKLARQFHDRQVRKFYLAIAQGVFRRNSGECRGAIGRHPKHRKKMAILPEGGRAAHTDYRVVEQGAAAALVECEIHTGRTHQIRVHLSALGHPIVGDEVYGRSRPLKNAPPPARQMLHAARLAFSHPLTGRPVSFEAPLPDDFRILLHALGLKFK